MKIHLDLETYCDLDLKTVGVYQYVSHPSFQITLIAYSYDFGPTNVIDMVSNPTEGIKKAGDLIGDIDNPEFIKVAHNANFDRVALSALMWQWAILPKYRFLYPSQWRDSMAEAAAGGWPQSLEQLAKATGTAPKDAAGTSLINYFAKPYRGKRRYPSDDPERWQQFIDYAHQDVEVLKAIDTILEPLTDTEQKVWELDQRINDRGIAVDLDMAKWAEAQNSKNSSSAKKQLEQLLDIDNGNSVLQVRNGLSNIGLELDDLRANTVKAYLDNDRTPDIARQALQLRAETSLTAAKKYTAAINMTNGDGRFRGGFRYHAAVTGRWGGRGIQLQNLPRDQFEYPNAAVADYLLGYDAPAQALKAMVRTMFTGPFIVSDFAAIEARVLAWIAGEEWALDAFRKHRDIYVETANRMGGLTRDQGKVAVLALGYGGGVGSLRSMGGQGTDAELDAFKHDWRNANRNIVDFWHALERDFESGGQNAGAKKIAVHKEGRNRRVVLPSGRSLMYRNVQRESYRRKTSDGEIEQRRGLRFSSGRNRVETYSGKIAENVTQAIARDLMAESLLMLDAQGYRIVGHIHDEVIIEIPDRPHSGTAEVHAVNTITPEEVQHVEDIMSNPPSWAEGLPLDAEGFRTYRYKKG